MSVVALAAGERTKAAYMAAVLESLPAFYFPLDDDGFGGMAADVVANLFGIAAGPIEWAQLDPWGGRGALAFGFDRGGFIYESSFVVANGGPWSVELWYRSLGANLGTLGNGMVNFTPTPSNAPPTTFTPALYLDAQGRLVGFASGGSLTAITDSAAGGSADGTWHHAAFTYDGAGTARLYRDGALGPSGSGFAPQTGAFSLQIGVAGTGRGGWWDGELCHLAYYRRQLTGAEIDAHYNATEPEPPEPEPDERTKEAYMEAVLASSPASYWPLDAGNAGRTRELVTANDADVVGGVTFDRVDPWGTEGPNAAAFDGTGTVAEPLPARARPVDAFTVECWYRCSEPLAPSSLVEFNGRDAPNPPSATGTPSLYVTLGEWSLWAYSAGGSETQAVDQSRTSDHLWHHAAVTFDGDTLTLYRDVVVRDMRSPVANNWLGPGFWRMGGPAGRAESYTGDLAHVAVYDRALALDELSAHYYAVSEPPEPEPPEPEPPLPGRPSHDCHRGAWLTLAGARVELEDLRAGYALAELNLGWPTIRDVVTNRPDADGSDDRTRLLGPRAITAHVTAMGSYGRETIDDIARIFSKFMLPAARPELHFTLNTPRDEYAERMVRLRAANYAAPVAGPHRRDITLAWVAPDPVLWDAVERSAIARPDLGGVAFGRRYDLRFNRVYPRGTGGASPGYFTVRGDIPTPLRVRIVGPITGPQLQLANFAIGGVSTLQFWFDSSFRIDASRWVEIDTRNRTVFRDRGENVLSAVRWAERAQWLYAMPGERLGLGEGCTLTLAGQNTDWNSQAIAYWNDGYLT